MCSRRLSCRRATSTPAPTSGRDRSRASSRSAETCASTAPSSTCRTPARSMGFRCSRRAAGVCGGMKTGPVVWLGEADLIDDRSLGNGGVKMLATLVEADWAIARGHNLKITAEYLDPNRRVPHDQQTRWSLLYELTPV